ncbi:TIP-1 family-domain-containing protein [Halteromyces radiatus]|uniref:TIP-1 family-domain-containing protein n=1 Tax=Halteromyces radiatus TaxID=101107 RepID=UPI00221FB2BF|nr:TIP-1 family-domain-containing protein [Halteromyces radiatus]KAI8099357.1 TIP-1 family-domain-containing protein [Halteromyces radiatus]
MLDHSLQKTLSDKSSLDHLYVALTTTKHQLSQICKDHEFDPSNHGNNNNNSNVNYIRTLADMEQRLRILDSAISYIKTLFVATHLWTQSINVVETDHYVAVQRYIQLLKFVRLICKQDVVHQGSFKDLGSYLEKCQKDLWETLNTAITKDFEASLQALDWPNAIRPPYGPLVLSKLERFEKNFRNLLLLEEPSEWNKGPNEPKLSSIITPIQLLLAPISLRFRFHFEGSRPTNRLDKPEWYLKHVKNQISTHLPFIMTTIQPIVDEVFIDHQQRVSAKDYFIEGLLKDVNRKVHHSIPKLTSHPNWLSHTIHELLQFDQSLRDDFGFNPSLKMQEINNNHLLNHGLVSDAILENKESYDAWFTSEKQFAQTRYDDITASTQAFDLYEGDVDMTKDEGYSVKATQSSVKLIHLWEGVIDTYKLVPSTRQQFQFFVYIQLSLLGQYEYRISSAVDSFDAMNLIRSVQVPGALPDSVTGVMTATESNGLVSVLKKLYRWWTSAQKLMEAIRDWEEDEFFLDLTYKLEQQLDIVADIRNDLIAQDKVCYVAEPSSFQTKGLFGDILMAYRQLTDRIEKICVRIIVKEWTVDTKLYSKRDIWWQTINETSVEVSDSLYQPLQGFWVSCHYLQKAYPASDFLSMYKHISLGIEDWYWRNIITKNQFSPYGVQQLETDLRLGLWKIGKRLVSKPENYTRRLKEALQVFTLPISSSSTTDYLLGKELMTSLTDTDKHTQVQATLEYLGIDTLTNSEIRDVLRRRNDMLNSWN